ncbi:MAG: hypothetical protein DDT37_01222 [Firmicutes bacterium]|nr:hypothetical protein [candidate division NPL-UPA2 bacterium]
MGVSLNWDGRHILANLEWKTLRGEPGLGFHRLTAQVEASVVPNEHIKDTVIITNFRGDLRVCGKNLGCLRSRDAETILSTSAYTYQKTITLVVELDTSRIEAIEKIRTEEVLDFEITLHGIAFAKCDVKHIQPVQVSLLHRTNQSEWLEILNQLNYQQTILLEIPVPRDNTDPSLSEAVRYFRCAQEHLLHRNFESAVAECRKVIESLSAVTNDKLSKPKNNAKESWSKDERFWNIQDAVKTLFHPAHHGDTTSSSIKWEVEDAKAAIAMTAVFLVLAGKKQ